MVEEYPPRSVLSLRTRKSISWLIDDFGLAYSNHLFIISRLRDRRLEKYTLGPLTTVNITTETSLIAIIKSEVQKQGGTTVETEGNPSKERARRKSPTKPSGTEKKRKKN